MQLLLSWSVPLFSHIYIYIYNIYNIYIYICRLLVFWCGSWIIRILHDFQKEVNKPVPRVNLASGCQVNVTWGTGLFIYTLQVKIQRFLFSYLTFCLVWFWALHRACVRQAKILLVDVRWSSISRGGFSVLPQQLIVPFYICWSMKGT